MKRTTVSMSDDLAAAVTREAHRRHCSVSELVRQVLARELRFSDGEPRELPFAALGRSGQRTTGRDMEELLPQEWDDDARRR